MHGSREGPRVHCVLAFHRGCLAMQEKTYVGSWRAAEL